MPAKNPAGRCLAARADLNYRISVDGGINNQTVAECARAGADTFVAGTALFAKRNMTAAVKKMRQIAHNNDPTLADSRSESLSLSVGWPPLF